MKIKKVLALLLALAMILALAACGSKPEKDPEKKPDDQRQDEPAKTVLEEAKGVTIPAFEVTVNGVKITNDTMADYAVYKASVTSTNTSGTTSTVVFIGFKVTDLIKAAGLTGTAGKLTATADDGYAVEVEKGDDDSNMLAISKDGNQFKAFPWFVPCQSKTTGDQLKGCSKITVDGMKAPEGQGGEKADPQGGDTECAEPDKQDKTAKVTFGDYCFKIDGKEIKNADLEGLSIYKVAVETLNKKGEKQQHTYTGYVLIDILNKLGINAGTVKVVANDGYESELGGAMVKNEYTILAIECDKETGKDGTVWVAPCSSHDQGSYSKLVVELKTK